MKFRLALPIVFVFAFPNFVLPVQAQVVPGTGQQIIEVFDDFEDPNWNFTLNLPKSSANIDKTERHPSGFSNNRTYLESLYRGTPDYVKRCETPPGGLPGSKGALAMQTLVSGIPGKLSHTFQQDDLIAGVQQKLGYMMPVGWTPSYTCRVYIPPFDKWERRHGSHFGFRADCTTTITKQSSIGRIFKSMSSHKALEQYWPGFFIQLNLKEMTKEKEDYASIVIRGDTLGHEIPGPKITKPGWWTLGMSFTPDGKVHYYGHEGVANLTSKDHLHSGFPYGYHCEQTSTFFFNIVNQDDGHSWSTRWIVDDPKVFVATGSYRPPVQQVAQAPAQQQAAVQQPGPQPPGTTPAPQVQQPAPAVQQPAAALPATAQQPAAMKPQQPATVPSQSGTFQLKPVSTLTQPAPVQPVPAATPTVTKPAPAAQPTPAAQPAPVTQQLPAAQPQVAQPIQAKPLATPVVQTPVAKPVQQPVAKPAVVTTTPAAQTKPAPSTTPSLAGLPQLASKPVEISISVPKIEKSPDNQGPTPAPAAPSNVESSKPAPSAPVIDDSAPITPLAGSTATAPTPVAAETPQQLPSDQPAAPAKPE